VILVDTGPLVAIANRLDDAPNACVRLLEGVPVGATSVAALDT
jgi:hypothetical protein